VPSLGPYFGAEAIEPVSRRGALEHRPPPSTREDIGWFMTSQSQACHQTLDEERRRNEIVRLSAAAIGLLECKRGTR